MSIFNGLTSDGNRFIDLHDKELVVEDILNSILTSKGDRVMRPNFGTIVSDLLFDGWNDLVEETVRNDIRRAVVADPRVELKELTLTPVERDSVMELDISLKVLIIPLNETAVKKMTIRFDDGQ